MRKSIALLAAVGALLVAGSAQAQNFGSRGQMAFSADRLFGVYGYKASTSYTGNAPAGGEYEDSQSGTHVNLLWGNSSVANFGINPYMMPRLSFDYFVIDGLSVGGSIGYATMGGETKPEKRPAGVALGESEDLPDSNLFAFAPRVGYAYMFNDIIGIWPRGGITYARIHSEAQQGGAKYEVTNKVFSLDIEAMLVIVPKEHFAFVVGPVLDLGLTGSSKTEATPAPNNVPADWDQDVKLHTYGLAAGMLGYF